MLAPHELKNKAFGRSFKGYNTSEVDEYVDFLIEKYTELYKENAELDRKLRIVTTSYDELRQEEEAIRSTLVSAQKMSNRIIGDANERADVIVTAVKERCAKVVADFHEQIEAEKQEMWRIRSAIVDFKKDVFELYGKHIEELQSISVNELDQIVLPDESEIIGKIYSDVAGALEQESAISEAQAKAKPKDEPLPDETAEVRGAALEDTGDNDNNNAGDSDSPAEPTDGKGDN